jgi:hypothetical protein
LQANGVVTSTNLRFGRKPCCPVGSDEYSLTVAANGPVLLQDAYLIEKLAHFARERIPDRVYTVLRAIASGWGGTAESVMFHQGVAAFELPQVGRDVHASHSFHGADLPGQTTGNGASHAGSVQQVRILPGAPSDQRRYNPVQDSCN